MYNEKLALIRASIAELNETINAQRDEIKAKLDNEDIEAAATIKDAREENKVKLSQAMNELSLYEAAMEDNTNTEGASGTVVVGGKNDEYRDAVNNFIRSKGSETVGLEMVGKDEILVPYALISNAIDPLTEGVVKTDTKPVTSEEITYDPAREVLTKTDLKKFTKIHPAKKGSGKYPILKKARTRMNSVAELEKNPSLAKPRFKDVSWEVLTYRGAIPLSQESIDDADVDLVSIVNEEIGDIKINTTNYAIANIMKGFAAKNVSDLDDLKRVQNVDLDPAYVISYVVSQSFYQFLDTIKDKNGRFLLQDSIISPTGKVFSGHPIFVISDEEWGVGEAHAWVGDIKRAILFADRKNLGLRWAENDIYGQYLQAVVRFDVKVADEEAGYFLTYTPPVSGPKTVQRSGSIKPDFSELTDEQLQMLLKERGMELKEDESGTTDYSTMSKANLQLLLKEKNIEFKESDNKDALIKLLQGE